MSVIITYDNAKLIAREWGSAVEDHPASTCDCKATNCSYKYARLHLAYRQKSLPFYLVSLRKIIKHFIFAAYRLVHSTSSSLLSLYVNFVYIIYPKLETDFYVPTYINIMIIKANSCFTWSIFEYHTAIWRPSRSTNIKLAKYSNDLPGRFSQTIPRCTPFLPQHFFSWISSS